MVSVSAQKSTRSPTTKVNAVFASKRTASSAASLTIKTVLSVRMVSRTKMENV